MIAASWFVLVLPIKNVMKKTSIFFDEEGVKFSSSKRVGTGFWSEICYLRNDQTVGKILLERLKML